MKERYWHKDTHTDLQKRTHGPLCSNNRPTYRTFISNKGEKRSFSISGDRYLYLKI